MVLRAARKGDLGSEHDGFPASKAIEGSPDIEINGKPAVRVGDAFEAHPHERHLKEGSSSVWFNGRKAGRVGDAIDCGGTVEDGSPDVSIGG